MISQKASRVIITTVVIIALVAIAFFYFSPRPEPSVPVAELPREVVLSGIDTCLPHRDTSGPQTLECALGLKADDGNYYALDLGGLPDKGMGTNLGGQKPLTVSGLLVPIEQISSDQWQKYDIKGIIKVSKLEAKS